MPFFAHLHHISGRFKKGRTTWNVFMHDMITQHVSSGNCITCGDVGDMQNEVLWECKNKVQGERWECVAVHIQIDARVMIVNPMKCCKMMDTKTVDEDPCVEFQDRVRMPMISKKDMEAQGMEPDHVQVKVMPLETLFHKLSGS